MDFKYDLEYTQKISSKFFLILILFYIGNYIQIGYYNNVPIIYLTLN